MTPDEIIDGILEREGEGVPPYTDPADAGGRTSWGIAEKSHPEAWQPGPPTRLEARAIYADAYLRPFDVLRGSASSALLAVIVDDAVLSGVNTAKMRLQKVARVAVDSVLGPRTIGVVRMMNQDFLIKEYVKDRTVFLVRTAIADPKNLKWLAGWVTRSLSFL